MNYYVACPARRVTGGVELAHQLCSAINRLTDCQALMWYTDIDNLTVDTLVMDINTPKEYLEYNTSCVKDFFEMDDVENVIIIPEGLTNRIPLFDYGRIALWWMSVDNYITATREEDFDLLADRVSIHLYQSFYSKCYVEKKIPNARGMELSDYINELFISENQDLEGRKDIALYNPRKGYEILSSLIKSIDWIEWIPLQGMNRERMKDAMRSAKIYVDFGSHPGKDRIPREAAANGCCIITNMTGAAAYYEDIPILDKYKFINPLNSKEEIETLMRKICDDYYGHREEFNDYRKMIFDEKEKFNRDVIEFVKTEL